MTKKTSTYNVNQFKQLIELNQNKTNFNLNFEIKSQNNDPFKALVVSEADLNSGKELNYKDVKDGYITGNIVNDKGVYQTYYLVLKSDVEVQCDVILDLKEIPLNPEIQKQIAMKQREEVEKKNSIERNKREKEIEKEREKEREKEIEIEREKERGREINRKLKIKKKESESSFFGEYKWIIIILVVVGIGAGVWFFFLKPKNIENKDGGRDYGINFEDNVEHVLKQPIKVPVSTPLVLENITEPIIETPPIIIEPLVPVQKTLSPLVQPRQSVPELIEPMSLAPPRLETGKRNTALVSKLNNYFGNL
jgi:hypothetical protein